ncbi:hypothetical protein SteCoe_14400 [Stentor coeruleus]|uniref:Guanylate cyclase domain-containing protein n=1 Tax=Stentor coeruleus TaxID=5963 RepID=A0A1R2C644_9CILI|nr:hypothetical protein SteCoe_14400 [Stentor coeruleus]
MRNRNFIFGKKLEKESAFRVIDFNTISTFKSNKVITQKYTFWNIIPKTVLEEFQKLPYIWMIFLMAVEFSPYCEKISLKISVALPLGLMILSRLYQNIKIARIQYYFDKELNNRWYQVFNETDFCMKKSQDISVCDLVLIKVNEIMPADAIILAVDSDTNEVFIDLKGVQGKIDLVKKKPVKETQTFIVYDGMSIVELLRHIENVKVIQPCQSFARFHGKIKIKSNPHVTHLKQDNFIPAGAKIINCSWVLTLVTYTGKDTKMWLNCSPNNFLKFSKYDKTFNIMMMVSFTIMIFAILLCFLINYFFYNLELGSTGQELFFNFVILFSCLLPISFILLIRIIKYTQTWLILRHESKKKQSSISIPNPKIIEDLGKVEYIITEKTGILTDNDLQVQTCIIQRSVYMCKENYEFYETNTLNHRDSDISPLINESNRLAYKIPINTFENLKISIQNEMLTVEKQYFFVGIIMCNQLLPNFDKCISIDDHVILEFGKSIGINVLHRDKKDCEIEIGNKRLKFRYLCSELIEKSVIKIALKNLTEEDIVIIEKGPLEHMIASFKDEIDQEMIEECLAGRTLFGIRKIAYGFKFIQRDQLKKFYFELKQAQSSLINYQGRLKGIFEKYASNLSFLGIIGIERNISPGVCEAVKTLTDAGMKLWISTCDTEESALLTGIRAGIINEETPIIRLSEFSSASEIMEEMEKLVKQKVYMGKSFEKLAEIEEVKNDQFEHLNSEEHMSEYPPTSYRKSIKYIRNKVRRGNKKKSSGYPLLTMLGFKKKNKNFNRYNTTTFNFALSVDSKSLDLALTTRALRKNLIILLFAARSVFFNDLTPEHKVKVVKLAKNNFTFKPTVVAITSEGCDAGVILEADIGVYLDSNTGVFASNSQNEPIESNVTKSTQNSENSTSLLQAFYEIKVETFPKLIEIILKYGHSSHTRMLKVIKLCIYKNFLLFSGLFWYQIAAHFSANPLIDYDIIVCYDLFVTFAILVVIGIFDVEISYKDLQKHPNLYSNGYLRHLMNPRDYYITIGQGFVHGSLVYGCLVLFCSSIVNKNGFTEDYESIGMQFFIIISIFFILLSVFNTSRKFLQIVYFFVGLISLIIIISITCNYKLGYSYVSQDSIIGRSTFWVLVCIAPIFCFISSSLNAHELMKYKFLTRIEQFSIKIQKVFTDSTVWKILPKDNSFEINKKTLKFKSLFKEREYVNSFFSNHIKHLRIAISCLFIIASANFILVMVDVPTILDLGYYTVIPTILPLFLLIGTYHKNINWNSFYLLIFAVTVIVCLTDAYSSTYSTIFRYPIFMIVFGIAFSYNWIESVIQVSILYIISVVLCIVETNRVEPEGIYVVVFHWAIIIFTFGVLILLICYSRTLARRNDFGYIQKVEIEVEKASNILSYLLPEFVKKRVKEGVRYIAEDKGTVSVVFCDMYDFDKIINLYTPQELTYFLDDIFGRIDLLCENLGVSKIETVGKTYLACAGLKDSESGMDSALIKIPHARRAIEFALAILKEMEKIQLKDGSNLMFKIGINSGPVTAGVVGYHKPQFSLVGDTVNTSSRMCSTLTEPNSIQISMITYNLIGDKNGLKFHDRSVEVKGKGFMDTKIVDVPKQSNEETNDESASLPKRNSSNMGGGSSFNIGSHNKISDPNHTPSVSKMKRSSLLMNLDFDNDKDLLKKANTQRVYHMVNFICKETKAEHNFRIEFLETSYKRRLYGLIVALICNLSLIILESIQVSLELEHYSVTRLTTLIVEVIFIVLFLILYKNYNSKLKYCYCLSLIYTLNFQVFFIASFYDHNDILIEFMYFMYRFLLVNFFSGLLFARNIFMNIINISIWFIEIALWAPSFSNYIYSSALILIILTTVYSYEGKQRINAVLKNVASKELNITEELLMQMMPPQALRNLQEDNVVTDRLSQVTIMYADIVGFTAWSSVRTSREVVGMLSELFTRFDKMCVQYNIYKVHTIGDCYVAMGYMDEHQRNPAKEAVNMLSFARSLIDVIEETNEKCNCELNMRIGMHTGEVIGGITGTKIVRYDIYGPDTNLANKMESNGEPGKITVSEDTKNLIENYTSDSYNFTFLKEIKTPVQGKSVKIYLVTFLNEVLGINNKD